MTKTKKITPQEWVQDYFCPAIGVLATPEANSLCQKNNLSMVELLQPFSKLSTDVTVKDPENSNHSVPNLCVNFQDFHKDPARIVGPRLLSDTVASITEEPLVSRAFPSRYNLKKFRQKNLLNQIYQFHEKILKFFLHSAVPFEKFSKKR